jgi:hypothetical protein
MSVPQTPLKAGARVQTRLGTGTVVYTRNGPPDYTAPEAVSVRLDNRHDDPRYSGTMFAAGDVIPEGAPVFDILPAETQAIIIDHVAEAMLAQALDDLAKKAKGEPLVYFCRTCGTPLNDDSTCNTCCV